MLEVKEVACSQWQQKLAYWWMHTTYHDVVSDYFIILNGYARDLVHIEGLLKEYVVSTNELVICVFVCSVL